MAATRSLSLLLVAACVLALAAAQADAFSLRFILGNDAVQNCHNSTSEEMCVGKTNCTWCSSLLLPSGCYHDDEATLLPKFAFKCDNGTAPSATAAPAAAAPKKKKKCDGHGSSGLKAAMMMLGGGSSATAAAEKEDDAAPPGPPGPPGPTPGPPGPNCSGATEEKGCFKTKGCVWCDGSFGPGSCYSKDQAAFLPKQFFKCKKHPSSAAAATAAPAPKRVWGLPTAL